MLIETLKFSPQVIVAYGSHLYDGTPEDMQHINHLQSLFPTVIFKQYQVDVTKDLSKAKGVIHRPTAYWHNLARWTATQSIIDKNSTWVFVVDCDEIPCGFSVKKWLDQVYLQLDPQRSYKINNYWYFKEPTNQATTLEDSVLLIHGKHLTEMNIFGDWERDYLIPASGTHLIRNVRGINGEVMFHHFSFVRTREGLRHKLKNWAHANDVYKNADIDKLLDEPRDFVHGYSYTKVDNIFGIKL